MKLGIIIDSSAGLTKAEADKKGWGLLPLFLSIDGKDYADGIDITPEKYYEIINIENDVRTSATPPGLIVDMFEKFSKKYDHVLVYGLSKALSSQSNNLMTFGGDFENVHIVESKGVGHAIVKDLEVIEKMVKDGDSIEKIVDKANKLTAQQYGLLLPATMKWLLKGGRVSPAAAAMGNLLKIIPIISFKDGELDKHGKGRVFSKAVYKTAMYLKDDMPGYEFHIYHGQFEGMDEILNELKVILGDKAIFTYVPPSIANHTGPEVIGIITRKNS